MNLSYFDHNLTIGAVAHYCCSCYRKCMDVCCISLLKNILIQLTPPLYFRYWQSNNDNDLTWYHNKISNIKVESFQLFHHHKNPSSSFTSLRYNWILFNAVQENSKICRIFEQDESFCCIYWKVRMDIFFRGRGGLFVHWLGDFAHIVHHSHL